ncbi:MAG: ATP-binding protein, partial [Limisphaerales bacterium]
LFESSLKRGKKQQTTITINDSRPEESILNYALRGLKNGVRLTVFSVPEPLPSFLDTDAKYVLLHVKDNGCGIQVANKQKIFNAFFTTYDHGTGLGLALVRRIIDGHGGGILESGIPGQGADFEIYLPVPPQDKRKRKMAVKAANPVKLRNIS